MKYNKLIGIKATKEYLDMGISLKEILNRRTGKSTAKALHIIAEALENPGKAIPIKDHFRHIQLDFFLCDVIGSQILALCLKCLQINATRRTLTYNLYADTDDDSSS